MSINSLLNESELLLKIAGGDQRAFTILFNYYERFVYIYSKKLTRSEERAGEIVQDIFLKIWVSREKLEGVENFGAYLNKLVRNHSLNVLRQLAQNAKSNQMMQQQAREGDESTSQQLDFNETSKILNEAVESLTPQQRMVYNLCHVEGMKYDEAAAKLNISSRTVHAHMTQALKGIRAHFKRNAMAYPVLMGILFKMR